MAEAYACDRCKKLFTQKEDNSCYRKLYIHDVPCKNVPHKPKDLCPRCQKELDFWFEGRAVIYPSCVHCKNFNTDINEEPCASCNIDEYNLELSHFEPKEKKL